MTSERRTMTQPADWWDAFQQQAAADGQTLSAWAGDCMRARLPASTSRELSERPPANRPKADEDGDEQTADAWKWLS
jgi:hypothetical protein